MRSVFVFSLVWAVCHAGVTVAQGRRPLSLAAGASMSACVARVSDGRVLYAFDPERRMCPASVTKLFTTGAAMRLLGSGARLTTSFGLGQEPTGHVLTVHGGFDPTPDSRYFRDASFSAVADSVAARLRSAGVDSLSLLCVDGSLSPEVPYCDKRLWEDMGNYYGATPTVVMFADNAVNLYFNTLGGAGGLCRVDSVVPSVGVFRPRSFVRSYRGGTDKSSVFLAGDSLWYVTGEIPQGRKAFRESATMPSPEVSYARHLAALLTRRGIAVGSVALRDGCGADSVLYVQTSPTLLEIARQTNVHSVNLFADALAFSLSTRGGSVRASWKGAAGAVSDFWKANAGLNVKLYDGSGLSPFNEVSASSVVALLRSMSRSSCGADFKSTLPRMGVEGTWAHLGKGSPLAGNVRAKSGTMTGVVAYAGFMTVKSGVEVAFCVIVNHFSETPRAVRTEIVDWLTTVFNTAK